MPHRCHRALIPQTNQIHNQCKPEYIQPIPAPTPTPHILYSFLGPYVKSCWDINSCDPHPSTSFGPVGLNPYIPLKPLSYTRHLNPSPALPLNA